MVPNFSTTIDAATGQTLDVAIPDLGDEFNIPSQHAAMRGYIALSRVTSADGLLIAQPFSPLLFRMGPQAWASLLFAVLQGRVPLSERLARCEQAALESKATLKMKDQEWECGICREKKYWSDYFPVRADAKLDPAWNMNYSKYILQPGCLRECLTCTTDLRMDEGFHEVDEVVEETHPCARCRQARPRAAFRKPAWEKRSYREAMCLECTWDITKSGLRTEWQCSVCGDEKPKAAYEYSVWKNRMQRPAKCRDCGSASGASCAVCAQWKQKDAFPEGQWRNRSRSDRTTRCSECWHPQCVRAGCATCRRCRDPECVAKKQGRRCVAGVAPLHSQAAPQTHEEVVAFLCAACRRGARRRRSSERGRGE